MINFGFNYLNIPDGFRKLARIVCENLLKIEMNFKKDHGYFVKMPNRGNAKHHLLFNVAKGHIVIVK